MFAQEMLVEQRLGNRRGIRVKLQGPVITERGGSGVVASG
jgi:hypothetical protein